MLVLSRKENETIEFPALGVVIRVFGLTQKRVQVGIDAPISLKIIRGEKRATEMAHPVPPDSVESIAEHVIEEEFGRLESELAALAELAGVRELALSRQVAADATERMSRIRRTMAAALRRREKMVMDQLSRLSTDAWDDCQDDEVESCLREPAASYSVCVA